MKYEKKIRSFLALMPQMCVVPKAVNEFKYPSIQQSSLLYSNFYPSILSALIYLKSKQCILASLPSTEQLAQTLLLFVFSTHALIMPHSSPHFQRSSRFIPPEGNKTHASFTSDRSGFAHCSRMTDSQSHLGE